MPGAGLQNYAGYGREIEDNPSILHPKLFSEDYFHEAVDYMAGLSQSSRTPSRAHDVSQ